jgi:hypothetical protein
MARSDGGSISLCRRPGIDLNNLLVALGGTSSRAFRLLPLGRWSPRIVSSGEVEPILRTLDWFRLFERRVGVGSGIVGVIAKCVAWFRTSYYIPLRGVSTQDYA